MTLLRKKNPTNGSRKPKRLGPYGRLSRAWPALFASLLLDPLLPFVVETRIPYPVAVSVASLLSLILLPCLAQRSLQQFVSRLRVFNLQADAGRGRARSVLILLALILGASPKLFALAGLSYLFLIIAGVVVVAIAASFRTALKQQRIERDLMAEKPWLQIERWEMQLVTLVLIPLVAARAISLCGVFIAAPADDVVTRLPFLIVSALFLGMLKPDKRLFLGHCKRCKLSVPIVLVDYGSCIRCDQRLLVSYIENLDPDRINGQRANATVTSSQQNVRTPLRGGVHTPTKSRTHTSPR